MMERIRVAFVDHADQLGGAQNSLLELLASFDRQRVQPLLVCSQAATWAFEQTPADVVKLPVFRPAPLLSRRRDQLPANPLRAFPDVWRGGAVTLALARALRAAQPDLVHTNTLKAHILGGCASRWVRCPLVWHVRDLVGTGAALRWLLRVGRFARPLVIAISEAVAQQFAGSGLSVTVVPNGINLDRFTPGPVRPDLLAEIGLRPEDEVVCVVSRLTPWKGHQTLLEAMSRVVTKRPRAMLVVVGEVAFWEEAYAQELRKRAAELGVADRVRWLGFRPDVDDLLRLCDVCVLPSTDEPFGRVIVEAMAVGKPVVATRSGGVPEVVEDGVTGLLVPPGDADALSEAIIAVLADPLAARRMGERGMECARARFDVARVVRAVEDLYDELVRAEGLRVR